MNILQTLFGGSSNSLSVADLKARIDSQQDPFIVDVRQPDEYRGGHILGAKLIPLDQLKHRMKELPRDRDILCVCQSGARSSIATAQLVNAGYKAVNMRGGMSGWQRAGYLVKKGTQ